MKKRYIIFILSIPLLIITIVMGILSHYKYKKSVKIFNKELITISELATNNIQTTLNYGSFDPEGDFINLLRKRKYFKGGWIYNNDFSSLVYSFPESESIDKDEFKLKDEIFNKIDKTEIIENMKKGISSFNEIIDKNNRYRIIPLIDEDFEHIANLIIVFSDLELKNNAKEDFINAAFAGIGVFLPFAILAIYLLTNISKSNIKLKFEIIEREKINMALEESEEKCHLLSELMPIGIVLEKKNGETIFANEYIYSLLNINFEEEHKNIDIFEHIVLNKKGSENIKNIISEELNKAGLFQKEFRIKNNVDEKDIWISIISKNLLIEDENAIVYVIMNITDRKIAEKELDMTNKKLIEVSRLAGKAEIATDVMHNVGNALNSVNINADVMGARINKIKTPVLNKVAHLLSENKDAIAEYLTQDEKGKMIPNVVIQFAEYLTKEQEILKDEVKSNKEKIDHIINIISMQQSFAKNVLVKEFHTSNDLMDSSIDMNMTALERHDISIIRDYEETFEFKTDKHKVLQILINLINNSKDAFIDNLQLDKKIICGIRKVENMVEFSIKDNGSGITKENINKIFNHGFTTKKTGHGFGLHNSANNATQLGGNLEMKSDGIGKGATFTLKIPLE